VQLTPPDLVDLVLRAAGDEVYLEWLAFPWQPLVVHPAGQPLGVDHVGNSFFCGMARSRASWVKLATSSPSSLNTLALP